MQIFALHVCVCVCERERERERVTAQRRLCVCARVCERGRQGHTTASFITVSVTRICSPLGLEVLVKLRTLLTVFTFILKAESRDYGKGRYISNAACGVRPITMHCASWPIRADCVCRKEGLFVETKRLKEAGNRGPTIMYSIWKTIWFWNIKACQHIILHQIYKILIFTKASYDPFNVTKLRCCIVAKFHIV